VANENSQDLSGLLSEKLAASSVRAHIETSSLLSQQRQRNQYHKHVGHSDGAVLRQEEDW